MTSKEHLKPSELKKILLWLGVTMAFNLAAIVYDSIVGLPATGYTFWNMPPLLISQDIGSAGLMVLLFVLGYYGGKVRQRQESP